MAVKKGFFFSLDAFFAIMIFTLVLVSIYGYFVNTHELRQQYFFSEDLFDIFINTRMSEIDQNSYLEIYNLYNSEIPEIKDNMYADITIMEQIITLKNNNTEDALNAAQLIIEEITNSLFGGKYGFNFNVEEWIYGEEGNIIVSRQRFVSGIK